MYDDPDINGLRYAASDARAVYDVLTHPATGGFRKDHFHLLASGAENEPTRSNILESLTIAASNSETGGHGSVLLFRAWTYATWLKLSSTGRCPSEYAN